MPPSPQKILSDDCPFGIPEILSYIILYLKRADFFACVLVSKKWNEYFLPYLWEYVSVDDSVGTPIETSIHKYARFVRSIEFIRDIPHVVDDIHFPHLQLVDFSTCEHSNRRLPHVLFDNNPSIEEVRYNIVSQRISLEFWETLSKQTNLKRIYTAAANINSQNAQNFWKTFCQMESAKLHILGTEELSFDPSITPSKLKSLIINTIAMKPKQQLDIVIKCTNLEHLRWFSDVRSQDSTDIFCKEILNKTWPNLHQIEVSVRLDNIQLQQILSSLSRLTVLKVAHANWGSESFDALSGHFGTLEELLVQRSISFGSEMVNEVMSSCPKLHMLSAVLLEGVDIIGDDQISNNKSQRAWVCTQLTDLSVQIDMRYMDSQIPVFERIASLSKLRVLDLTGRNLDGEDCISFTLTQGLDILKPLKSLYSLGVPRRISNMTEEDINWIIKHWKNLSCLYDGIPRHDTSPNKLALEQHGIKTVNTN